MSFGNRQITRKCFLACLALFFAGVSARSDDVGVKGQVLRGKVVNVSGSGIEFETEYGKGKIAIAFADIESLETDRPLVIFHGDRDFVLGRLLGVREGKLLVGEHPDSAEPIDVKTIAYAEGPQVLSSLRERVRNRYRFWDANVDFGAAFKDSTTDDLDVTLAGKIERRKAPTRFVAGVNYLLSREREKGESSQKTDNEIRGRVRGEYDLAGPYFLQTIHSAEYDEIDHLSLRWIGGAGPGYRVFDTKTFRWQLETGFAYNYERFFGGRTEEYPGIPLMTEGKYTTPVGAIIEFRGAYLISAEDWLDDYLIRAEASVSIPVHRYLSFKISVYEEYNETPDEGTDRNEVKTMLGLSWRF